MMIVFNMGTEARPAATLANAEKVAAAIVEDLKFSGEVTRHPEHDRDGWFRFNFGKVEVDIPGDDPEEVYGPDILKARRLYVDGSSWLYGYALGFIAEYQERPTEDDGQGSLV